MRRVVIAASVAAKLAAALLWRHSPGGAVACFFGPDLILLYGMLAPRSQLLCPIVTSFAAPEGRRLVWLTIDDGPDPDDTPRLLDLLDRHGARATFFCVGRRAQESPEILREIVRRGHQIGHHSHSHPKFTYWIAGPARTSRELDDAAAVFAANGVRTELFRPPVGIKNLFLQRALSRRRLNCIGWTIRSRDCFTRAPQRAVDRVLRNLRSGAIILTHEGRSVPAPVRVRFIELLLQALDRQGYRCVIPGSESWRPPTPPRE